MTVRYIELKGGLGDVIYGLWHGNHYTALDDLRPHEKVIVGILSSNPAVAELFRWHPKASQIEVREVGYVDPWGPEERHAHGLPDHPSPLGPFGTSRVRFHPSPADRGVLHRLGLGPYVVFALSAGVQARNVPSEIAERAAAVASDAGYAVVSVGRTYENWNQWGARRFQNPRREERLVVAADRIDLIDQLSLPGTAVLVGGASGVFCCSSGIMHLAWRLGRPTFVLCSDENWREEWTTTGHASWGLSLATTCAFPFSRYADGAVEGWLRRCAAPQAVASHSATRARL